MNSEIRRAEQLAQREYYYVQRQLQMDEEALLDALEWESSLKEKEVFSKEEEKDILL